MSAPIDNRLLSGTPGTGGFSLLELLVVVAVIGILGVAGVSALQSRDGSKLRAAQEALISQVQAARNTAIARNAPCRLLIDAKMDAENGRRRMAIAVQDNLTLKWELLGTPVKLPDGVAVLVDDGVSPASTGGGTSAAPLNMNGSDLGDSASGSMKSADWYYLTFDPSGTSEDNAGAILIVGSVRHDGSKWTRKDPNLIRGVMVRRAGQASAFIDPDHIREAYNAL